MRDSSGWSDGLVAEIAAAGALPRELLTPRGFFAVELALHFLATHLPGEPVGALWPVLSGYVVGGPELTPIARRLRHRMGDFARSGYLRHSLDQYRQISIAVRAFDRTDDPARRVGDRTVFAARTVSVCAGRTEVYQDALDAPVPYRSTPDRPAAQPGLSYHFTRADKATEQITIPMDAPAGPPPPPVVPRQHRERSPWRLEVDGDLARTAAWIDDRLGHLPDTTERNQHFVDRLERMAICTVDEQTGQLIEKPGQLEIDGLEHVVGLMNSGKSTLADLLTVNRVREGFHVTLVLSAVQDVHAKVAFLRRLGIDAVPLVGRGNFAEHAARYWRSALTSTTAGPFPEGDDPAAQFLGTVCLLETARDTNNPSWSPLSPRDFPCRGALRPASGGDRLHDCPLLAVCPHQATQQRVATAAVWVTTAAGLLLSRAEPSQAQMRWLEACQHHTDLLIVDEADIVQQHLDEQFLQYQTLVSPDAGWTDRTTIGKITGFDAQKRRQLARRDVDRFSDFERIHQRGVDKLYTLALTDPQLADFLGKAPFSSYSLLLQVARLLHGLPLRGPHEDAEREDQAEVFFRSHLEFLTDQPFAAEVPEHLREVTATLREDLSDPDRIDAALVTWLRAHAPGAARDRLAEQTPLLVLLFQAGYWAGRITASFFEMSTLYAAVAEEVQLADPDTFWQRQPPADYQALVPEAPMGNLLALQWLPDHQGDSGTLRLLWVRGVGRHLLHHLHDLLEPEGVAGPHVVLTSATSWSPRSTYYDIPVPPRIVLREPLEDRDALASSTMAFRPVRRADGAAVRVSGRTGAQRQDALREVTRGVCLKTPGTTASLLERVRARLEDDRRQVLFVVLSGHEAQLVADFINQKTTWTARNVTPDAGDPGEFGIRRRSIAEFADSGADILVAAEMAIQRGYNILNSQRMAALGAVFYLARPHPSPDDPMFPLSLINQRAMRLLLDPIGAPASVGRTAEELRRQARAWWYGLMSRPVYFSRLHDAERGAFVANALVPMSQTIGRSIRGNRPTRVFLCDAAFAPRHADPRDRARDTPRTSLLTAAEQHLTQLLTPPPDGAAPDHVRDHAIAEAVWGLMHGLITSRDMGH